MNSHIFDDDFFNRVIIAVARDGGDFIHNIHALHDVSKNAVLAVQE